MNSMSAKRRKWIVNQNDLYAFAFVMYLCVDFARVIFQKAFGLVGLSSFASVFCYLCICLPLVIACLCSRKIIAADFWALFTFLVLFFLATILIHPDYEYWYTRYYYGVWDYVFRPDNGLYIYLFIRLLNDPRRILKYLRISAYIMIIYFGYRLIPFLRNGYWTLTYADGTIHQVAYNLEYGYDMLLYVLGLLYCALTEKRVTDWAMTVIGVVFIMLGGSRGPFLCFTVFLALYFGLSIAKSRKRALLILLTIVVGVTLFLTYQYLLAAISVIMNLVGFTPRILKTILMGTVSDDNGRIEFWTRTLEMIRDNPFGYGAMGTRHVLYVLHTAAYPHNFFLEIMADLGVFIGGGLSIFFIWKTVSILRMKDNEEWKGLFLVFLGMFSQLMLSSTFYHRTGFWGALAVGVCIYRERSRTRKELLRASA